MFTIRVDWEPSKGTTRSVYSAEKYTVNPVVDQEGFSMLELDYGKYHIYIGPKDQVYVMNNAGATVDRIPH